MEKQEVQRRESVSLTDALRSYFAGQSDVVAAYLFGSQATDKARPQSDVDTAVLLSEEDDFIRLERRLRLIFDAYATAIIGYLERQEEGAEGGS